MPKFGTGFEVYIQNTAPIQPSAGDFWFDTSGATVLNFFTPSGGWVAISIPTAALNTLSNSVSVLSNAVSVLSQSVSAISQSLSALSNAVSVISNAQSVLSNAVSVLSQAVSVHSQALSVLSQNQSVLSQNQSVLSQALSVLSQQVSVISAGLGGMQLKVVQGTQGVSATAGAGTNVSGLSASVAASGGIYQIEGAVIYQTSALPTTLGLGLNFPGMVNASGIFKGGTTISQVTSVVVGQFNEDSSNSMTFSIAVSTVSTMIANVDGIFAISTAGTIQVIARVSATTQPVNIQAGSYLRAYKIK